MIYPLKGKSKLKIKLFFHYSFDHLYQLLHNGLEGHHGAHKHDMSLENGGEISEGQVWAVGESLHWF